MKRPVSLVPFVLAAGLLAGCGGAKAGKAEFAQICAKRMASVEKCGCYVDSIEKALTPEQFATLAEGAHQNRDFAGAGWLPVKVQSDQAIAGALTAATTACFG